jgi:hypothetical protein
MLLMVIPRTILDVFEMCHLAHLDCCCNIDGDSFMHDVREHIGGTPLREWTYSAVPLFAFVFLTPQRRDSLSASSPLYNAVVDAVGGEEVLYGLVVSVLAVVLIGNVLLGCVCCCTCGFSLATMRALCAKVGRITAAVVALTTTSSPLAFLALLVARAFYLWLHENWDDATRERIARTRRATNNYRQVVADETHLTPLRGADRDKECVRCVALLAAAVRACVCVHFCEPPSTSNSLSSLRLLCGHTHTHTHTQAQGVPLAGLE